MDWITIILFASIILQELQIISLNKRNMILSQNVTALNQMMTTLIDKNISDKIIVEDRRTNVKDEKTDK